MYDFLFLSCRSDVLGQILPVVGANWAQSGVVCSCTGTGTPKRRGDGAGRIGVNLAFSLLCCSLICFSCDGNFPLDLTKMSHPTPGNSTTDL